MGRSACILGCAIAIGTIVPGCTTTTYYVPRAPAVGSPSEELSLRETEFPDEGDVVGTIIPPRDLDEAYQQQFAKCFSIERERDKQATAVSASRYATGALGIALAVVGSALIGYVAQKNSKEPDANTGSLLAAGSGFVAGGIALSSIASFVNFERRVDANRKHREEVRRAMMRANAEWNASADSGNTDSDQLRKARLLKNMADVCGASADLESALSGRTLDEIIQEASEKAKKSLSSESDGKKDDANKTPDAGKQESTGDPPPPIVPQGKPGALPKPLAAGKRGEQTPKQ